MSYRQEFYLLSLVMVILWNKKLKILMAYSKQWTFISAHMFGLVGQVSSLNWANGEEGMLTQTSAHLGWSLSHMWGPGWNNWADAALSTIPSSSRLRQAHKQSRNRNAQFALKTLFASHLISLAQENHLVKPAVRWKGTTEQRVWIQGGHWCNQFTIRVKYDLKVFRRNRKWLS